MFVFFSHSCLCFLLEIDVQGALLEPVQRIPRYKLLLSDYLKRTPEDHPDYENTQSIASFFTNRVGSSDSHFVDCV